MTGESAGLGWTSPGVRYFFGIALGAWCLTTILFVDETEFVVVERLGRIVAVHDRPMDRGWRWKAPWPIDRVRRFDARLQFLEPPGREVFTSDRKNLVVQGAIGWRIAPSADDTTTPSADRPVVRFLRGLQSRELAEGRLASRLQSLLTTEFARWSLTELLTPVEGSAPSPLGRLSEQVRNSFVQATGETEPWTTRLGVEILDIRLLRLQFPAANQPAVYERMRSERRKMAERYRSAGQAESTLIRSQADRQARELEALANAEAGRIEATAERDALRTLNEAYRRDPAFAERLQALEAYRAILGERTTLVLSADHPLWRFLSDALPVPAETNQPPAPSAPSATTAEPMP